MSAFGLGPFNDFHHAPSDDISHAKFEATNRCMMLTTFYEALEQKERIEAKYRASHYFFMTGFIPVGEYLYLQHRWLSTSKTTPSVVG
jgi:hypothetical protein